MKFVLSKRAKVSAFICLTIAASGATAQTYVVRRVEALPAKGYQDFHITRAAIAGQQVRLWWATMINPDCKAAGTMTTEVLEQPRHGTVKISDDPLFPSFVPPNPRAVCDAHKVPGMQAFYTPASDFHGHDKLIIQNATSEGRIRKFVVDVDVR